MRALRGFGVALAAARAPAGAVMTARRGLTSHVFFRLPPEGLIPTHFPDGSEVDADAVIGEMNQAVETLSHSRLAHNVVPMASLPYWDAIRHDVLVVGPPGILMMPKRGIEHRSAEMSETVRYLRSQFLNADILNYLQDDPKVDARANDFLPLEEILVMSYGTERTNVRAYDLSHSAHSHATGAQGLLCIGFETYANAPPLNEYCAFAGDRFIVLNNNKFGQRALQFVDTLNDQATGIKHTPLLVDADCQFLSWCNKGAPCNDVLVEDECPDAMEVMARAGLNPLPVEWRLCKKLGIHLRSFFLHVSYTPFGYDTSTSGHHDEMRRAKESRRHFTSNPNTYGAKESRAPGPTTMQRHCQNIQEQLELGEIAKPVFQTTPRYRPKMYSEREGTRRLGTGDGDGDGDGGGNPLYARAKKNRLAIEAHERRREEREAEREADLGSSRFDVRKEPEPEAYDGMPPQLLGKPFVEPARGPGNN